MGKDLFLELAKFSPSVWGAMSPDAAARFTPDFEAGMRFIWETYPNAVQPPVQGVPAPYELMQTLAVFFLQFQPDGTGSNLYLRFVQLLVEQGKLDRARLATLNYETLLESALAATNNDPRALRPHGAVNWWIEGVKFWSDSSRAIGAGLHVMGKRVGPIAHDTVLRRMQKEGKYPAMAIYMHGKLTQMGQRKLRQHQSRFRNVVSAAERIIIVGVRPYPSDEHVWDSLARAPGRVYCVGDRDVFEEWHEEFRPRGESLWIEPTFEGAIDELCALA